MRTELQTGLLWLTLCFHIVRCSPVAASATSSTKDAAKPNAGQERQSRGKFLAPWVANSAAAVKGSIEAMRPLHPMGAAADDVSDEDSQKTEDQVLVIRPPQPLPATAAYQLWVFCRFYVFLIVAAAFAISLWQNAFSLLCTGADHLLGVDGGHRDASYHVRSEVPSV